MSFSSVEAQRVFLAPRIHRWYPDFRTGGEIYHERIERVIAPTSVVVDAGCGGGGIIERFHGRVQKIIGVDIDEDAMRHHTGLDEYLNASLEHIPLPDASVDLIVSEFVAEHLAHPGAVWKEYYRILKPGGHCITLTPNVYNPVICLSAMTPRRWHEFLKRRLLKKTERVFPTFYRSNTIRRMRRQAANAGFRHQEFERAGNPEYLAFEPWLAVPAILLERLLGHRWLRDWQMYIVADMRK